VNAGAPTARTFFDLVGISAGLEEGASRWTAIERGDAAGMQPGVAGGGQMDAAAGDRAAAVPAETRRRGDRTVLEASVAVDPVPVGGDGMAAAGAATLGGLGLVGDGGHGGDILNDSTGHSKARRSPRRGASCPPERQRHRKARSGENQRNY
jgi:hypothetical protein